MIKLIDTQVLYPQSTEVSNKQQIVTKNPELQQNVFADLMREERAIKHEQVQKSNKDEKVADEAHRERKHSQSKKKKGEGHKKDEEPNHKFEQSGNSIDIRI